ncbi:hypothetical protein [Nonomuraea cavernae]|nr:hypothetical protein [Nonomuraea cavernae]MCA2183575.1 hypothetical protein [Nonomuraea cavernae]
MTYTRHARYARPAQVDGDPGLAFVVGGRLVGALGFTFTDDKIMEMEGIFDPERLRRVVPEGAAG